MHFYLKILSKVENIFLECPSAMYCNPVTFQSAEWIQISYIFACWCYMAIIQFYHFTKDSNLNFND